MSRIGAQPITIPQGTEVTVSDGGDYGYKQVLVKGSKGELSLSLRRGVEISVADQEATVTRKSDSKKHRAYHGLYRTLVANMVEGVTNGYKKELHIEGIGYRAQMIGQDIELSVGYSHKILATPPAGVTVEVADQTEITVSGPDKQLVGEFAAKLRDYRKPEPYKGKGIRYKDEQIKRKTSKSTVA